MSGSNERPEGYPERDEPPQVLFVCRDWTPGDVTAETEQEFRSHLDGCSHCCTADECAGPVRYGRDDEGRTPLSIYRTRGA
jgi:hypothetical protein